MNHWKVNTWEFLGLERFGSGLTDPLLYLIIPLEPIYLGSLLLEGYIYIYILYILDFLKTKILFTR